MTFKYNDGGPAFPVASDLNGHQSGMTMRQWYAGQIVSAAMSGASGINLVSDDDLVIARIKEAQNG